MVERKTWEEFRESMLLWWINRLLHTFGWAIVFQVEADGHTITDVYPARVSYRGFNADDEADGFRRLTQYLSENIETLRSEVNE